MTNLIVFRDELYYFGPEGVFVLQIENIPLTDIVQRRWIKIPFDGDEE